MSDALPLLRRCERMVLLWDEGTAYRLDDDSVLLIALSAGIDERLLGVENARAEAERRVFAKVPPGYSAPTPESGWLDLLVEGYYGFGRKYVAKKEPSS